MSFSLRIWLCTFGAYALLSLPVAYFNPALYVIGFVAGFFLSIPGWLCLLFSLFLIKFLFPNSGMYVITILLGVAIALISLIYAFFIYGQHWDHMRAFITFPSVTVAAVVSSILLNVKHISNYMEPHRPNIYR